MIVANTSTTDMKVIQANGESGNAQQSVNG